MQKLSALLLLAGLCGPALAQTKVNLGEVRVVVDNAAIAVRVTANSTDLQGLAQTAFNAHGRYKVVGSGHAYDIKFTALAPTQVRVDVTRGAAATPVVSQVVNGSTARQALLRAADIAVEKTNGLNLRGFFTARLAFISQRSGRSEVYTSDLFFGEAVQLTHDRALALSPRWAPDGSRIIFTSYFKTGAPDIYLLDPASGRHDIFANYKGTNMGARFSPRGDRVAMVCTPAGGVTEIFTANARGASNPTRLTRSDVVKSSPCWSPDGSQIVFAMGEPSPQLYVIPAAGGAARRVASGFTYMAEPDWSRTDRNKIACTVRAPGGYQIAVVDLTTGTTKVVSKAPFDAVEPSWLADGRHLVYTARDRRSSVLSILDTATGNSVRLSPPTAMAMQAGVWTP